MKKTILAAALSLPLALNSNACSRSGLIDLDQSSPYKDNPSVDSGNEKDADINQNIDAGTISDAAPSIDATPDANPPEEVKLLTRGQLAQALKQNLMGYPDTDEKCQSIFPDIEDVSLCRSDKFLHDRKIIIGYPDGMFRPNISVNHAELAKIITQGLQLTPFESDCLKMTTDVPSDSWFYLYMGGACEKGISFTGPTGLSHPGDPTTLEEFQKIQSTITSYLAQPIDRKTTFETVGHSIMKQSPTFPSSPCEPIFPDVTPNSLTCFYSNYLKNVGLIPGYQDGTSKPDNTINNAEIAKFYSLAAGFPISKSGCSGQAQDQWYTGYVDALCDQGLADSSFQPAAIPSRLQASQLAWEINWMKQ